MGARDIRRLQDWLGLSNEECARLFAVDPRVYERWKSEGLGRTAIYEAVFNAISTALLRTDHPEKVIETIREAVKSGGLSVLLTRLLIEKGNQ